MRHELPPSDRSARSARAYTSDDEELVAGMIVALYVEDPSPHPVDRARAIATLRRLLAEPVRGRCLLLTAGGEAVGYTLLCSFWSNELGGEICIVDELYVSPAARGRGLSTWFLEKLTAGTLPWFPAAVAFELEVTPQNERARRLYERIGFLPKKNSTLRLVRAQASAR